jgi:hypothetical protein
MPVFEKRVQDVGGNEARSTWQCQAGGWSQPGDLPVSRTLDISTTGGGLRDFRDWELIQSFEKWERC